MSEHKSEDTFRVIDRRLFTEEGELRQEMVEEEKREAVKEANVARQEPSADPEVPELPPAETPKRSSSALTRLERSRTDIVSTCFTKSSVEIAISSSNIFWTG